eukprot:TRINITY_DN130_c0_g2_i1.p1 TRINITY_DN130_c0_g2~~TRINITY_DN130_c0_g2_i1.p1  ORF type:complete len:940 (+),score=374.31 TRINITY_DN130_c0_g2_i1:92-2911(+)
MYQAQLRAAVSASVRSISLAQRFSKLDAGRVRNLASVSRTASGVRSAPLLATRQFSTAAASSDSQEPAYAPAELAGRARNANLLRLITAYRRYAHVFADLDPLQLASRVAPVELDLARYDLHNVPADQEFELSGLLNMGPGLTRATLPQILDFLRQVYCSKIGAEFLYLQDVKQRRWFHDHLETLPSQSLSADEKLRIFNLMAEAEAFDHFMQKKFATTKRYALEGCEAMIPAIDAVFSVGAALGVEDVVIGMPHRGRLNLLAGLLKYDPGRIFWKVNGNSELPEGVQGIGDVMSHIGTSVDLPYVSRSLHVSLLQNPSHLEAVNPVALGKLRAKIHHHGGDSSKAMCVMFHGDAAFYSQGTVAESLGLAKLPQFSTGGSVHIIVNNQVGFTTTAAHGRSSRYSADVGKMLDVPVLHVNADSPEDVVKVCRLAMEYRQTFQSDIIVDIIGYRRHGHNEVDEPSFTQPRMYRTIRAAPTVVKKYAGQLEDEGLLSAADAQAAIASYDARFAKANDEQRAPTQVEQLKGRWKGMVQPNDVNVPAVTTGFDVGQLKEIGLASVKLPDGFQIHQRLSKFFVKPRVDAINKGELDWATAEAMAFGSLLKEGHGLRLCGQDSGRGTFSQRHLELVHQETEAKHVPINQLGTQAKMQIVNSPLSELAVLGFEYGFSLEDPKVLPLWEAQFGDFANGAQVMIDTFITSGESKWLLQSGLTMLLPHGYDGAGPEHSSSRIERFLQLSDADSVDLRSPRNRNPNFHVIQPTTPSNYFHALRRQMKRNFRKPLVVIAPKTLLRHAKAVSRMNELDIGTSFQPLLPDTTVNAQQVERVVFCSGKVYYDLLELRQKQGRTDTALVRLEELVPFPLEQVEKELGKYKQASKFYWVQDETQNSGAWEFVRPRLSQLVKQLEYIGRPPCPACAVGISKVHKAESAAIFDAIFPAK